MDKLIVRDESHGNRGMTTNPLADCDVYEPGELGEEELRDQFQLKTQELQDATIRFQTLERELEELRIQFQRFGTQEGIKNAAKSSSVQEKLMEKLKQHWGFDSFREMQLEAVETMLDGKDTFIRMATGRGKSLCFQLPALLMDGVTVVISPLIALMKDQVDSLREKNIAAAHLGGYDTEELKYVQEKMRSKELKLLYLSPETFFQNIWLDRLEKSGLRIAAVVVDEAHCISEWGKDFRTEYAQIGRLLEPRRLHQGKFPVMALTATATKIVQNEIISSLRLQDPVLLVGSSVRPNLNYVIQPRREGKQMLKQLLELFDENSEVRGQPGIIYALSKKMVEEIALYLNDNGVKCSHYHSEVPDEQRAQVSEGFRNGKIDVVVATIAFGMGIDRPDVRFVIHTTLPKTLDIYLQETGRAGRDGKPSLCLLLWRARMDVQRLLHLEGIEGDFDREQDVLRTTSALIQYTTARGCRHQLLADHMDDDSIQPCGTMCDFCRGEAVVPSEEDEIKLLRGVEEIVDNGKWRWPKRIEQVAKVFRGSQNKPTKLYRQDGLQCNGILKRHARVLVEMYLEHLIFRGLLEGSEDEWRFIKLSQKGIRHLEAQQRQIQAPELQKESGPAMPVQITAPPGKLGSAKQGGIAGSEKGAQAANVAIRESVQVTKQDLVDDNWRKDLTQALVKWRTEAVDQALTTWKMEAVEQQGVPRSGILHDQMIKDTVTRRPADVKALVDVTGDKRTAAAINAETSQGQPQLQPAGMKQKQIEEKNGKGKKKKKKKKKNENQRER